MSDIGIFIFGMLVFGVAIGSTLISVLGGSATPVQRTNSPEKNNGVTDNAVVVSGNG